jgi:putative ATP-dependent endonuclease of OLD family
LIRKNLDKTGIAYRIAHELDQEIEKESHLQTLKLQETESNDTVYYLLEAIRYVTDN